MSDCQLCVGMRNPWPLHGGTVHPCCDYWIAQRGRAYCVACAEARRQQWQRTNQLRNAA